ncbi:PREDICTED: uncharacterized protein LOC106124200 [Papilio xuthus]|uniref:Uncharacterized protein LOC106124200 n=1 Tax=Papilio xuthus TaxID=66420 RepID=A0AAJ6ZNA6_PAPXU|nr:PREDICTED: uncharacterized protein LOC106124200 [Papilio xuthus]
MYHNLIIVFLLYLLNNLYGTNARRLELKITDPNGRSYTNKKYHYREELSVVLKCQLSNNQTMFEMFWMLDGVKTRVSTASTASDELMVVLGGREPRVQCEAREVPAGDGTTNLTASVTFVKDTQTTTTLAPKEPDTEDKGVASSVAAALAQRAVLYAGGAAALLVLAVAFLLATYFCKRSSDKRLLEFELDTGESEAAVYASPRDDVRGHPAPPAVYTEPFRETGANLMYSTPIPKCERTALKTEMGRDENGSYYEYVRQVKQVKPRSCDARYVNGLNNNNT